jgi:hypothetical protein
MFQLSKAEHRSLRRQFGTLPAEESKKKIGFTTKEAQKSYAKKPTKKKQSIRKTTK